MHRLDVSIDLVLLPILIVSMTTGTVLGQDSPVDIEAPDQLILNIYIDDAGRALINGYVDDPGSLSFLNSSEYTYEDESRQIYAITAALTSKSRDNWTVSFESEGSYEVYHVLFYLPANAKLRRIDVSSGLDYLVSSANETVIAEIGGSDITDPAIDIGYLLSFAEAPRAELEIATGANTGYSKTIIALVLILGCGILIFLFRSRLASFAFAGGFESHKSKEFLAACQKPSDFQAPIEGHIDEGPAGVSLNGDLKDGLRISEKSKTSLSNQKPRPGIEITSEISAVMDTLTDKEQSILRVLLRRGGMMTQTELRYEVDISKSSLSGVLTSMEKRKIITKKGKGRTNVIELSERFLNHQERS